MRLTYPRARRSSGKSAAGHDEVEARFVRLQAGKRIEQDVVFESADPAFSGVMRMIWTFQPELAGTRVTIRAENAPAGIRAEDDQAGMNASLAKLDRFLRSMRSR